MSATPITDQFRDGQERSWSAVICAMDRMERELTEANVVLAALQEAHGCDRENLARSCGYTCSRSEAVTRLNFEIAHEKEEHAKTERLRSGSEVIRRETKRALEAEREKVRVLREALRYLPIHDQTDPFASIETIREVLAKTEDKP